MGCGGSASLDPREVGNQFTLSWLHTGPEVYLQGYDTTVMDFFFVMKNIIIIQSTTAYKIGTTNDLL
jgi:hypothetical protein